MNDLNPSKNHSLGNQGLPKVYLLSNLITAGNLFFGFMAIIQIIEGTHEAIGSDPWILRYETSLRYILFAFICDLLDGRVARLGGQESDFGKEFDSLADVVSFGLAPALLVLKIILVDLPSSISWIAWLVAFIYLLAGAMRLARFNVISSQPKTPTSKDFMGFPIPAAAGVVASITLLILTFYEHDKPLGKWIYLLPVLLILLSFMMYSKITYPSFKSVDWKAKRSIPQILITFAMLTVVVITWRYSLSLVFVGYLIYGLIRPYISKRWRKEIEEDEEDTEINQAP